MSNKITAAQVASFAKLLSKDPSHKVSQRAVTINGIYAASENNFLSRDNTTIFSNEIETGSVTNQEESGRCWLFAELNVIRHQIAIDHKMDDLELSQSYSFFWDKLEKSNMFLERIIATAENPLDERYVTRYMEWPQGDGGWWEYAADVIEKYGVVPKHVMPESVTTTKSHQLNILLNRKLRQGGLELRKLAEQKSSSDAIQQRKTDVLAEIYRFLTVALGAPPQSFDFTYKDKDKKLHRDLNITPKAFLKKYYKKSLADYAVLVNDPTPTKSYGQMYQFEHGGNVVGGREVTWLNVDMETLKKVTLKQLKAGESLWFGCDVVTDTNRKGFMSLDTYDFNGTFGVDFEMDKAQRLMSRDSSVNHAMTITGVDLIDGKPAQWKVENSWGDERGFKGYYTMSNDWFDKNGYVVVVRKDLLSEKLQKALTKKPVMVPAWDPLNLPV
jgi:bleomycin hydrolase